LEIAEDSVVDGKVAVEHFLEVLADIAETEVQALERLELRGYASGEGANSDVANVTE
jgi:hypothetical protein